MLPGLPILYSFRRCPYAIRARLALHASDRRCELREIVLRDKAPEFLNISPKGTVPVLLLGDGTVIEESFDIMIWTLRRNDPEKWLQPELGSLEEMLDLVAACDDAFKSDLDAYKYASRDKPERALEARGRGAQFLAGLDARLADRTYLFGDRISLADMAIVPFVRQFANVDRAWFDSGPWRRLCEWLDRILVSDRFSDVMQKYARWQAGDLPVIFGRAA